MSSKKQFNFIATSLGIRGGKEVGVLKTKEPKKNKYGAISCEMDGYKFPSKLERDYYIDFKYKKESGRILDFELHKAWEFIHDGVRIGKYTCDFYVTWLDGSTTVYDVKGGKVTASEAYRLRKKMMLAFHKINIIELH